MQSKKKSAQRHSQDMEDLGGLNFSNQINVLREEELSTSTCGSYDEDASTSTKIVRKRTAMEDDMEEVEEENIDEGVGSEKKKIKMHSSSNNPLTPHGPRSSQMSKDQTPPAPRSQHLQSTQKSFRIKKFVCPAEMLKTDQVTFMNNIQLSHKNLNAKLIFGINAQPILQAYDEETASKLQEDMTFNG